MYHQVNAIYIYIYIFISGQQVASKDMNSVLIDVVNRAQISKGGYLRCGESHFSDLMHILESIAFKDMTIIDVLSILLITVSIYFGSFITDQGTFCTAHIEHVFFFCTLIIHRL